MIINMTNEKVSVFFFFREFIIARGVRFLFLSLRRGEKLVRLGFDK